MHNLDNSAVSFNVAKNNLSLDDIEKISILLGQKCGSITINSIKKYLIKNAKNIKNHEYFDRLIKKDGVWKYIPKKSYLEEIKDVRYIIIKGGEK